MGIGSKIVKGLELGKKSLMEIERAGLEVPKNVRFAEGNFRRFGGHGAVHGTDEIALEGILEKGLRAGSALDVTKGKEWASELPVMVSVPGAKKGRFIRHNKYFTSAESVPVSRVTVNLDEYAPRATFKVKQRIMKLAKKHPDVKFTVLNDRGPYVPEYDVEDVTRMYDELGKMYKERDPELVETEKLIADIRASHTDERGITHLSSEGRRIMDELYAKRDALLKLRERKIRQMERLVKEAEADVDYALGIFDGVES